MVGWRVLTPAQGGNPTLLIKPDFKANEYSVFVTDLIHIWQESLSRKSIIRRALDDNPSIDPLDQLKLFLEKLQSILACDEGTSRKLLPADNENDLILELQADLPGDFKPLVWRMALKLQPGDVLFQQLLLPAFERSLQAQHQVQSLVKQIEAKDHVISQLQEKLVSTGTDLANVFPGAHPPSGSKTADPDTLYRAIPALRPFNETRWRQATNQSQSQFKTSADLFQGAFANLDDSSLAASWESPDHWWRKMDQEGQELGALPSTASTVTPSVTQEASRPEDDNDGFQLQDHPKLRGSSPQLQVKDSQPAEIPKTEDSMSTTDDGGDHDDEILEISGPTTSTEPGPSPPKPAPSKGAKRIGMLGRKQTHSIPASPPPVPDTSPATMEPDMEPDSFPPPPGPRKKLGRIGGGRQHTTESDLKDLPMRDSHETSRADLSESKTARPSPPQAEDTINETEEEKAERRRAELKRALDEKKKAPAKKRRRF